MRAFIVAIATIIVLGIALPAGAAAAGDDGFPAKSLGRCLSTAEDWDAAGVGDVLPFGGVRFYAKDGQKGYSRTICLTDTKVFPQQGDPFGGYFVRLGRMLRRNVESLRVVGAAGCQVTAGLRSLNDKIIYSKGVGQRLSFDWAPRVFEQGTKVRWRDVEIPERLDDRVKVEGVGVRCGDAVDS